MFLLYLTFLTQFRYIELSLECKRLITTKTTLRHASIKVRDFKFKSGSRNVPFWSAPTTRTISEPRHDAPTVHFQKNENPLPSFIFSFLLFLHRQFWNRVSHAKTTELRNYRARFIVTFPRRSARTWSCPRPASRFFELRISRAPTGERKDPPRKGSVVVRRENVEPNGSEATRYATISERGLNVTWNDILLVIQRAAGRSTSLEWRKNLFYLTGIISQWPQ